MQDRPEPGQRSLRETDAFPREGSPAESIRGGSPMISARIEGTRLEVALPPALLVGNRMELIEAVTSTLRPVLTRVRLDAAALREIDSAGLGALARVLRESIDATSAPPELVNARVEIIESMRAVRLLRHFDLRTSETTRWNVRLRHRGLWLARGFTSVQQANG
jgi:ABC-type transporter Mla MlaB component